MSMFDIELKNSSMTKSMDKNQNQMAEATLPKKILNNEVLNGSTVPSTGNGTGVKSTLSVKSHVMQYMANTDKLLAKVKKPEIGANEIPREQSLNLSGLEIAKSPTPKEEGKSQCIEITNVEKSTEE